MAGLWSQRENNKNKRDEMRKKKKKTQRTSLKHRQPSLLGRKVKHTMTQFWANHVFFFFF